jgi:type IV pilus assembly protein PilM
MKNIGIGLDINTSSINVIQLDVQRNDFVLRSYGSAVNTPKGMLSESLFDQEQMADKIRETVAESKPFGKNVNIALADNQVFTKVIDMPFLSEKELSTAIFWEAEQYIPAQLNTMTLDWHVLQRDDKNQGGRMQVLLVAAPTMLIKKYQSIMEMAGLSINAIETEILSVVRAVVSGEHFPSSLVIHIGSFYTSFAIIQNDIIIFTYSFPMGGTAMNRAIASDFGFTVEQAEEYKKIYGLTDQSLGGKIGKAIEPVLASIIAEVKKALIFYNDKFKNQSQLSQVLLTGNSVKLPGIDVYFVKHIGIETVIVNPWVAHNIQQVPQDLMDNGPAFSVAVGLALRDYENE